MRPRPLAAPVLVLLLAAPLLAAGTTAPDCLSCHADRTLSTARGGRAIPLFTDAAVLGRSAHASLACGDCHQGLDPDSVPHATPVRPVDCASCHPDTADRYRLSAHGTARTAGDAGAPTCVDCHGAHGIGPAAGAASPVGKAQQARTCLGCHLDRPEVRAKAGPSAGFIASFESSVHGKALASGNLSAATCSDCHGAHDMRRHGETGSRVDKMVVLDTCGCCHAKEAREYRDSAHGAALLDRHADAPACTDCHGEHGIAAAKGNGGDPRSRAAIRACAACHGSERLVQKYGLSGGRLDTFADSYHGQAARSGSRETASCASCHGAHAVFPAADPRSSVHRDRLAATCGACHPGANANFAKGAVHVSIYASGPDAVAWIRLAYIVLIVGVVGGMAVHNLLDFVTRTRLRLARRAGRAPAPHHAMAQYERMGPAERVQHGLMAASFIVLVVTGFMLKFPDAWWMQPLREAGEPVFALRGLLHRVAGAVMILVCAWHLAYVCATARGRTLMRDMLPRWRDLGDAAGMLAWNLGLSARKPAFDRFSYVEKSEYWALAWGSLVMAATGLVLWFDNAAMGLLTKLGWDISCAIHYYEAVLATLAIVVWHFYFVIFNPDIYPMKTAWLDGKISEEEMLDEHPLELERIKATGGRTDGGPGGGHDPAR